MIATQEQIDLIYWIGVMNKLKQAGLVSGGLSMMLDIPGCESAIEDSAAVGIMPRHIPQTARAAFVAMALRATGLVPPQEDIDMAVNLMMNHEEAVKWIRENRHKEIGDE